MTHNQSLLAGEMPALKRPSLSPVVLALVVAAMAAIGGAAVVSFIGIEEKRELLQWQNKLSLIADSRAADVEAWLDRPIKELGAVAENPSLQLYMTELETEADAKNSPAEDPAQMVFLRNLLSITADRLGLTEKPSKEISSIHADVHAPSGTGLAIVDTNGKILVATAGLPTFDPELARKLEQAPKGEPELLDMYTTAEGTRQIGFVLPIYAIQEANNAGQSIGRLVGVRNVGDDLFKLLKHPGVTEKTLEAVLLRREGQSITYLSPQNETIESAIQLSLDTPDLDAAFALIAPGSFAVKKNSLSHTTLVTSRVIAHSPWTLMLHIDRDQAMAESDAWRLQVEYSLLFALLATIGGVVAVWTYGTSKRTMLLSDETRRWAEHSASQEKLLRLVTDNQLEPIVIVDEENIARFANAKAAQAFHLKMTDVVGKDLVDLVGNSTAAGYLEANKQAVQQGFPFVRTWMMESGTGVAVIRSQHIPLHEIPINGLPGPLSGVLMIDQDITLVVKERERRMRVLRGLVDMLVRMVDRRDPYAGSHSACVALVARAVAVGMGLDPVLVETAEIAGNIMNAGKIVVPSEVLTKSSALTEDEIKAIRDSLQSSIALLDKIEFDGPVVDTLRQAQEYYDGTGPLRLRGEKILVTARIIAVANAFIGMVSPRSYRHALSFDQALKILLANIDAQFDRRVVVALANYVENSQGREEIESLVSRIGLSN